MRYSIHVTRRQRERIPLLLRSVGIDHLQEPIRRPQGFPIWQIFYGVSGNGEFFTDGTRAVLRLGQIAVLAPHTRHGYRSLGGDWVLHYLGFEGLLCQRLLSVLGLGESGVYIPADPDRFLEHLHGLECLASAAEVSQTACSKELYALLLDLSVRLTRLPDSDAIEGSGLEKEIVLYLEDHFAEDISLDSLSERFQRTPEYLCSLFKAATGESIMHYLRRIRIHQAKIRLMDAPDASLSEIAESCGFHSVSYFGKVFREATGFTPQGYRLGKALQPPAPDKNPGKNSFYSI
ncbi:MAG: helix-turn-helix transcriptional regulator [Oscillospiraceae bacterium]|nr:helix-turn-helix transcriptional regulator [Oscillospiraceae bacterium]